MGSLSVNYIRLIMAFFLLGFFSLFTKGMFLPLNATSEQWGWLLLSGFIGFVIGDLFLFQAFVEIGSRISMLIMSSAPPITAIASYFILGEKLNLMNTLGVTITVIGISMVILVRKGNKKVELSHPIKGIIYALLGALGQSFGLIVSKLGMGNYNPFQASQIRVIAGIIGFTIFFIIINNWKNLFKSARNKKGMAFTLNGAFFGPFIGVSFSLLAVQYTKTGIASTIMAIVPVLIIPISIFIFKEKVTLKEILGAVVTVLGVGLLFLS